MRVLGAPPHCPRPGPSRPGWLPLGEEGGGRAASPHSGASEGRREGGPPLGQPGKKTFFQRKQPGSPLASAALRLLGTVRPRPGPRVEAEGHSPCFATPVGTDTPWDADYSHPSAMTPFRSAQCKFRAQDRDFQSPKLLSTYVSDQTSQQTKCQETCFLLSPNPGR